MRRTIGFLALLLTVFCALPLVAQAIDFGGISARPANPNPDDGRTAAWFIYALAPGGERNDSLVVENYTGKKITLEIYPADSAPSTGGGFALKQQVEKMTGVGGWVSLENDSITLSPNEKKNIPFRLTVPKNIAPGLYAGGIIVGKKSAPNKYAGVSVNTRVGVRMYITVVPKISVAGSSDKNAWITPYWPYSIALALIVAAAFYAIFMINKKSLSSKWLNAYRDAKRRIKKT